MPLLEMSAQGMCWTQDHVMSCISVCGSDSCRPLPQTVDMLHGIMGKVAWLTCITFL